MALSQIYTAIPGDIITASRWNNEFGNLYNNGTDEAFPVTKNVSFAGFTLTLDASGVTTLLSPSNSGFAFNVGAKSGTPGANGALGFFSASTFTDTNTAPAGIAALYTGFSVRQPTLAASAALVTTTKAASVYIENAPAVGTNETLTNAYALYVDDGKTQLDGDLQVDGAVKVGGALTVTGAFTAPVFDPYLLTNLRITATLAGNAMTIALKTDANVDPSSSDKIRVRFRSGTLATGGTTEVDIASALSVVVSSGSTLGTVNAQPNRLYIGLLNNGGAAELFVYNPLSGSNLRALTESMLLTTTSEGGAGAADSAQVAYSTTGRATKAFRIIGFVESTQATAGTWVTAISTIQELQPWMPRTGAIVSSAIATNGVSSGSLTTLFNLDDTPSPVASGSQIVSLTYTPVNALNLLEIEAQAAGLVTQGDTPSVSVLVALFTDVSTTSIVCSNSCTNQVSTAVTRSSAFVKIRSAALGAMTSVQLRGGAGNATGTNTWSFNSASTSLDEGATFNSYVSVTEIMV